MDSLQALSPSERREWDSLKSERDAELRWDGLLRLADRLESRDKLDAAVEIYGSAALEAPEALQAKAQGRLDAIAGRGAVGARVEFHLRRLARDASDYRMIAPMMAGTAVYGLAKSAALGRFALASRPAWWMRGAPGRFGAASIGYASEVPAFAFSSRILHASDSNRSSPLLQELASVAITLGLLKSSGALTQSALHRVLGPRTRPGLSFAAGQASMFAGLWSAHRIERGLGLRPGAAGDTELTDIFSSMLSLGIGAQFGKRLLGSRHALRSAEFDLRFKSAGANLNLANLHSEKLQPAGMVPTTMWMSAESGDSGKPAGEASPKLVQVSSGEIRIRQSLRKLKAAEGEWIPLSDLADKTLTEIREDRRWTSSGKSRQVSNLAFLLDRFGPGRGNPELAFLALAQLGEVRALKISESEYCRRIWELEAYGEIRSSAEPERVFEKPPVPLKSEPSGHGLVLSTFEFMAQRIPAWQDVAHGFRRLYLDLAGREIWQDRLIDLMERSLELSRQEIELTPPMAERWLRAFEEAVEGRRTWESFEAMDPLRPAVAELAPEELRREPPPKPESSSPAEKPKSRVGKLVTVSDLSSAVRLFSVAGAASGGAKDFHIRLLLPNLEQLSWRIRADADGNLQLLDQGRGQKRGLNGEKISIEVERVEGYSGRFRIHWANKSLLLDLQAVQERSGGLARLELAPNQPEIGDRIVEHFSSKPPAMDQVKVEHAEAISVSSLRGTGGVQLRYQFYLSNGDLVELTGATRHHDGGSLEVKQAWLRRFGDPEDLARPLEVSANRVRPGQFRILLNGASGYRLDFEIQVPKGANERFRPTWSKLEVLEAPPPMHLRWSEKAKASPELDSSEAESSIRGLAADALFGEAKAVEKMGELGRLHDAAIWELKDLFAMTWEPGIGAEDFGGQDLVRLREKIGAALRDSGRQNSLAKKVIVDLEKAYGAASMFEEAPALPSLPPPQPDSEPPPAKALQPSPSAERRDLIPAPAAPPPISPVEAKGRPKPEPKPQVPPLEALERRIQEAVRSPQRRKSFKLDLPRLVKTISAQDVEVLSAKYLDVLKSAIVAKNTDLLKVAIHISSTCVLCLDPESRTQALSNLISTLLEMMQTRGLDLSWFKAGDMTLTNQIQERAQTIYKPRESDSAHLAKVRRMMSLWSHSSDLHIGDAWVLQEAILLSDRLAPEEAAAFRIELWGSLQLHYLESIQYFRRNADPNFAKKPLSNMVLLFHFLIGATSKMTPQNQKSFFGNAGFWQHDTVYRYQPFPDIIPDIIEIHSPLLTSPALTSSQAQPKKN